MRHPASLLIPATALALALMPPPAQAQFDPSARIQSCVFKHEVRRIESLGEVPAAIRDANGPMAEKNAFFNATDVFMRGLPNRGFVSAGQTGDRYFVRYQQGGIALFSVVAVYRLTTGASPAQLLALERETGSDLCLTIDTLLDAKPPR